MFIMKQSDCNGIIMSAPKMPHGPSAPLVLNTETSSAGYPTLTKEAILTARLNELNEGTYRLCFATKESLGDTQGDWITLSASIHLYNEDPIPTLTVPHIVSLGQDIIVTWSLNGVQSTNMDWMGLYKKNECIQTDYSENNPFPPQHDEAARNWQNRCFIDTANVPAGQTSGEVRFSYTSFKNAGEYEVRWFMGNSRNGHGMVCRGMGGLMTGRFAQDSATSESCALEAKATSNIITVSAASSSKGGRTSKNARVVHHIPGLEHSRYAPIGL